MSISKMIQRYFREVIKGCFKHISSKFQGVSRAFQGCFEGVSKKFLSKVQEGFNEILWKYRSSFEGFLGDKFYDALTHSNFANNTGAKNKT